MRMHANEVTSQQVYRAADGMFGVYVTASEHGSRSHARAFEIALEGNAYRVNTGTSGAGSKIGATWDEWGIFMARLYVIDPTILWGSVGYPTYANAEHFHWVTGGRFLDLTPETAQPATHKRHRWTLDGTSATGSYHVRSCKCGALYRSMAHGRSFAEIAS